MYISSLHSFSFFFLLEVKWKSGKYIFSTAVLF